MEVKMKRHALIPTIPGVMLRIVRYVNTLFPYLQNLNQ